MKQEKSPQHIVQQQLALDVYLKTLLEEVPEASDDTQGQKHPVTSDTTARELVVRPVSVVETVRPVVESSFAPLVELENRSKIHPLSVMPEWARHEFQALFFKVDHMILATPLTELSRTLKLDRKPGKIPGQPSWFLGLLDDQDSRIGVLDTGQLVFGKTRGGQRDLELNPFKRILVTQDKRWGLACDEILSIGRLKPEKVRWRTSRTKKPWLIGTVIEELTAIIDVQALVPSRRNN